MSMDELSSLIRRVEELETRQQYLDDRQAILDCLTLYTHAIDRHAWEELADVYHDDGLANHGDFVGDREALREFLEPTYLANYASHTHHIVNHLCKIDGDVADAETSAIVMVALKDGSHVNILGARYIDRLEKRNGQWKIALRRIVVDWRCRADQLENYNNFPIGRWDRQDLSFVRPIDLPESLKGSVRRSLPASTGESMRAIAVKSRISIHQIGLRLLAPLRMRFTMRHPVGFA